MGSYSTLYIGARQILATKSEVAPAIMTLFQVVERSLKTGTIEDIAPSLLDEDRSNASEQIELLTYETTVNVIKDRLDLMGFTINFARKEFERAKEQKLDEFGWDDGEIGENQDNFGDLNAEERAVRELSFDRWLDILRTAWTDKDRWETMQQASVPKTDGSLDELLLWYVTSQIEDLPWSVFNLNARLYLRAICEISHSEASVVYDLSDLIYEIGDGQDLASTAELHLDGGYATTRRIIVLTEGRTDQRAIEGALRILHPALANYFSFLDFDMLTVPGGVTSVLNTLKALIAVGIANRVVALLDNDTGAHSAVQAAKLGTLPQHVRIVFLPNLSLAENYPTLGPTGLTTMNINGLACSIELYFGADVLTRESGQLVPIQWKGYDEKLKRYQGEIMRKGELQALFWEKLGKARENPASLPTSDWAAMQMVVHALVTAFQNLPPMDYDLETTGD